MNHFFKTFTDSFLARQKTFLLNHFQNLLPIKGGLTEHLLKKYFWSFFIAFLILIVSCSSILISVDKEKEEEKGFSLDQLVPEGFVLMPLEISNSQDILDFIGSHGVIDLYVYSNQTRLPEKKVASHLRVIPPQEKEGMFTALVPEKEAVYLLGYSEAFYAVIQNPKNRNSKIYKKQKTKTFVVIEEDF